MQQVRLGIIGLGSMGAAHAKYLTDGRISRAQLTAAADPRIAQLAIPDGAKPFAKVEDMIASGLVDAVLIATPHYFHVDAGIAALKAGLHVLVEKPLAVHKADCERLLAAHTNPRQVFAEMFQLRTVAWFKHIRQMIQSGDLGTIRRINWITTDWYRTNAYYALGSWRATWAGEGGGVLVNQCPHNFDMWQWLFGMPARVRGFCQLGRYHDIEVEDDLTAYFEYADGATGVFITSTGEAPGTNRLEIAGENGRLVLEGGVINFTRNAVPMTKFSHTTDKTFARPDVTTEQFTFPDPGGQHITITQNFVDAILDGVPLIAPAAEGLRSVELANAILFSSLKDRAIELPLDGAAFERQLKSLIRKSKKSKRTP